MKYTIEQLKLAEAEKEQNKLQLEDYNLKPLSTDGWIMYEGKLTKLINSYPVAWEVIMEDGSKEYLFTWQEAIDEAKMQGKRLPTDEEFTELLKTKYDLHNIVYPGYRNTNGSFYYRSTNLFLWSSTESSTSAFDRGLDSGNATVYRLANDKLNGFSARCIKY